MLVIEQILQINALRSQTKNKVETILGDVSMHFRVGDYAKLPSHHPLMTRAYYENALNHMESQLGSKFRVTYFCEQDDKIHVLDIVNYLRTKFPEVEFDSILLNLEDYEEMLIMSLHKHHIIANSSFSWWGAYLNTNTDKVVCYPKVWFGPKLSDHDTSQMCPLEWTEIDT
jgi:hypothetical protein